MGLMLHEIALCINLFPGFLSERSLFSAIRAVMLCYYFWVHIRVLSPVGASSHHVCGDSHGAQTHPGHDRQWPLQMASTDSMSLRHSHLDIPTSFSR